MQRSELIQLNSRLSKLYQDQWPGLTPGMADHWLEVLGAFALELMQRALDLWLEDNTFRVPKLRELLGCALDLQREDQAAHALHERQARAAVLARLSAHEVLQHTANRQEETALSWAREHVRLFELGACRESRWQEAAAICDTNATKYPEDAAYWHAAAAFWRSGELSPPLFAPQGG